MAIAVTFYTSADDPRQIKKTFSAVGSATTLSPLEPISNLEVRMKIDYQAALMNANYFAADSKYYKITDRKRLPAGGEEIVGKVDVLATYQTQLQNCGVIAQRSANMYNADYPDNKYAVEQDYDVQTMALWNFDRYTGQGAAVPDSIFTLLIT